MRELLNFVSFIIVGFFVGSGVHFWTDRISEVHRRKDGMSHD